MRSKVDASLFVHLGLRLMKVRLRANFRDLCLTQQTVEHGQIVIPEALPMLEHFIAGVVRCRHSIALWGCWFRVDLPDLLVKSACLAIDSAQCGFRRGRSEEAA